MDYRILASSPLSITRCAVPSEASETRENEKINKNLQSEKREIASVSSSSSDKITKIHAPAPGEGSTHGVKS